MQGYYISHDADLTVNNERLQACNCIYYHNVSIIIEVNKVQLEYFC